MAKWSFYGNMEAGLLPACQTPLLTNEEKAGSVQLLLHQGTIPARLLILCGQHLRGKPAKGVGGWDNELLLCQQLYGSRNWRQEALSVFRGWVVESGWRVRAECLGGGDLPVNTGASWFWGRVKWMRLRLVWRSGSAGMWMCSLSGTQRKRNTMYDLCAWIRSNKERLRTRGYTRSQTEYWPLTNRACQTVKVQIVFLTVHFNFSSVKTSSFVSTLARRGGGKWKQWWLCLRRGTFDEVHSV